jgi:hypothetical protein
MQVAKDLVGTPPADELDGGAIHLSKKEGHARRARAEMSLGWRPRVCPISVAEARSVAVMAVLGTRRQRCRSMRAQRGVSGGAANDRRYKTRRRMT